MSAARITSAKNKARKTALVFGGRSPEREVSFMSAARVEKALKELREPYFRFDSKVHPVSKLEKASRALIVAHGGEGENGVLQGALQMMGVPFTGSNTAACALAMDKPRSKLIWREHRIATPDFCVARSPGEAKNIAKRLGLPLFVKPADCGSSIGAGAAQNLTALSRRIAEALRHSKEALVEKIMTGGEYTLAVLDNKPLPVIRVETPRGFYDYRAKYMDSGTRYLCPCGLPARRERAFAELGMRAFFAVGASGWGRVDMMATANGRPTVLEVNTVPGMTGHSLVPMAAQAAGINFAQLIRKILRGAK